MKFLYAHEIDHHIWKHIRDHYLGNEYLGRDNDHEISVNTFVIIILVINISEKLRDHYLGNEFPQIHYLQSLI
jgi:hypothetical protein